MVREVIEKMSRFTPKEKEALKLVHRMLLDMPIFLDEVIEDELIREAWCNMVDE